MGGDRKSTRLNSSHLGISYAVFCPTTHSPPPLPYTTLFRSRPGDPHPLPATPGDVSRHSQPAHHTPVASRNTHHQAPPTTKRRPPPSAAHHQAPPTTKRR